MAGNMAVAAFLGLGVTVGLFCNVFLILTFIQRKRMRTVMTFPASILYVHLAVMDLVAMALWTLPTILSATAGEWALPDQLCYPQVYIRVFCNMANVLTLLLFMFERCLRIFKPSKHREIFFDIVAILMVVAVYIFVGTLASFPMWGWGKVKYFEEEYQCAVSFQDPPSYFDFSIAVGLGIPGGLILVGYVAILVRVHLLKRKRGPNGVIVLEENFEVIGDSYSDRLKKLYESFKDPDSKLFAEKDKDDSPFEDSSYLDSDCFDSDLEAASEEKTDTMTGTTEEDDKPSRKMPPKKCYYLGANDMGVAHMYALLAGIYMVLWIPFYVRFYQHTYQYFDTSPSDGFILAAVCMTHLSSVYKVPFYLMSRTVRGAFRKTLGIRQNEKRKRKARSAVTNQD